MKVNNWATEWNNRIILSDTRMTHTHTLNAMLSWWDCRETDEGRKSSAFYTNVQEKTPPMWWRQEMPSQQVNLDSFFKFSPLAKLQKM